MIFDGRPVDEIRDDEITRLVRRHVSERQHVEFKATFEYRKDAAKQELLRDVVAMANGGGGYLIIGVRDDGYGRAQAFSEPALMERPDSIVRAIRSLCHNHISERIEGIEIRRRNVNGNSVVIVRVPVSGRRPHMVTLNHRTDFVTRVEDGKREMSLGEIRESFVNAPMGLRLDRIDARLSDMFQTQRRIDGKKELAEALATGASDALLREEDGHVVAEVMRERFEADVGNSPYLWLSATAVAPRRHLIALDRPEVAELLSRPPGSRPNGWNMADLDYSRRRSMNGVELGAKEDAYLEVYENGHMEFWRTIGEVFCRDQSAEERRVRPRLYPYAVVEYPVSFLRLASAILSTAGYSGEVLIQLQYRNIGGHVLRPGRPREIVFESPLNPSTPFAEPHLLIGPIRVPWNRAPDEVGLNLLKFVYRAFGVGVDGIPFLGANGVFSFGH